MKPLVVDLACGLGGWTEGFLAEGYRARGYDIEAHEYDRERYPGELVLRDLLTLHGSEVADADCLVASPPCQEYSWMAMPWSRAKQVARALRGQDEFPANYQGSRTVEELNALFNACFRIQREASEAAGRHIPMVVENVKGAQPWVGRARWSWGSFFLWGDVPALMPPVRKATKNTGGSWFAIGSPGQSVTGLHADGRKLPGFRFDGSGKSFQSAAVAEGVKGSDGYERDHPNAFGWKSPPTSSSAVSARKAASARIAKIPEPLSRHIARVFKPRPERGAA